MNESPKVGAGSEFKSVIQDPTDNKNKTFALPDTDLYIVINDKSINEIIKESGKTKDVVLSSVQPADIESVVIWKSEEATKRYGQQAAKGAIVIKTKNPSFKFN